MSVEQTTALYNTLGTNVSARSNEILRRVALAGGWRLAKTNITDWTTVIAPPNSTVLGYEIFGSNDGVLAINGVPQAVSGSQYNEFFVKITYTKGSSASIMERKIQVGYGYDNATGNMNFLAGSEVVLSTGGWANDDLNTISFISAGIGRLGFAIRPPTTFTSNASSHLIIVERIRSGNSYKNRVAYRTAEWVGGGSTTHNSQEISAETSSQTVFPLITATATTQATYLSNYPLDAIGTLPITLFNNRVVVGICNVQGFKIDKLDSVCLQKASLIPRGSFVNVDINGVKVRFVSTVFMHGNTDLTSGIILMRYE